MKLLYYSILLLIQQNIFAIDYAQQKYWAALPTMQDNADWTPSGILNGQDSATVDVFFIHPTTDIAGFKGNADIDNKYINKQTDKYAIKYQASVFNESCKVYAPRYQQATLHNFYSKNSTRSQEAFDIAYADIKNAFEYYLQQYNQGRPIVIASHSQGTKHAQRLLLEFFDGKPLQKKFLEAYLIGFPIYTTQFQYLKVSEKADTFGGFISYSTFGQDTKIHSIVDTYNNAVSVNPLSWTTDKYFVSGKENKGVLATQKEKIIQTYFGAKNGNGILEIQKPEEGNFVAMAMKNYHIFDYALFYMNIRENVALRIKKYFENHQP